jgi:hypothetical protein
LEVGGREDPAIRGGGKTGVLGGSKIIPSEGGGGTIKEGGDGGYLNNTLLADFVPTF